MTKSLISINKCRIENKRSIIIPELSWEMKSDEVWLVIGPNGGGKADFLNALSGSLKILPNAEGLYSNLFKDSTDIVSLERAARLIQEERENDESEYVEGGVDIGRTGRVFISGSKDGGKDLDNAPEIKLCGIQRILDRGLKYMSTGEIRRTLLAHALVSQKQLLILSDPFAGLDIQSRTILLDFFNTIAKKQNPHIILGMERWHEIPDAITNVIEFAGKEVSFCGSRSDYETLLEQRKAASEATSTQAREDFANALSQTLTETEVLQNNTELTVTERQGTVTERSVTVLQRSVSVNQRSVTVNPVSLIEMKNVNVGWGDNRVLIDLNWTLHEKEHWLVRGPNGSGKTTFLELITGDNKQVFCNEIYMFGNRRGTGETIWDIKKQLGIVSYRLHVEYRMVGSTSLRDVIISGFHDSIGLYETATDVEIAAAKKWLALGGFEGRESETFGNLSYGEQRAILILRSAVKCPKILILDEPCHGLDEQYREKILHLMELIAQGGTTTLLHVTHDPSEVLPCENHILELHPGETPMYKILIN